MDGWGSLTMLLKRQNANKYRKAQLRYDLQKKKEAFLSNQKSNSEFDFPELSTVEMEKLKKEIRSKIRREKIKNKIISLLILIAVIVLLIWIIQAKNQTVYQLLQ